ncbi:MAG: hypothetical protein ACK4FL_02885 [Microgenomates group bacterium]
MKNRKILKVGFDLDGVILDNPIRSFRLIAKKFKFIKPIIFKQEKEPFYYPNTKIEKFIWRLLHKTSWRINPAIKKIKSLVDNKKINAYLITGRYSFLKDDSKIWFKKLKFQKVFRGFYFNNKDLQPNEFKVKIIKKLKLDIYVEDNWDIIEKLNSHTKAKIFWITNLLDKRIPYRYKFNNLKEAIYFLEEKFL